MLMHLEEEQGEVLRGQRWQAAPVRSSYAPGTLAGIEDERQTRTLLSSIAVGFGVVLLLLMFLVAARTGSGANVDITRGDAERIVLESASGAKLEQWRAVLGYNDGTAVPTVATPTPQGKNSPLSSLLRTDVKV